MQVATVELDKAFRVVQQLRTEVAGVAALLQLRNRKFDLAEDDAKVNADAVPSLASQQQEESQRIALRGA